MPSLKAGEKVLVTGASGYIATWIVKSLLENGFHVRGTVRSEEKGKHLQDLLKEYGDRFEYVVVGDMTADGAFDEAVKGVDAIEHTASPFHFKSEDPDVLIKPAIKGTTNILESALKHSPSLKRVVILASVACVLEPVPSGQTRTFTEKDWNEVSAKEVAEKGKDALPVHKYRTSKVFAEKAAWDFGKANAGKISWDIVSVNPPFVWGPPLQHIPNLESLNTSLIDFNKIITGKMNPTAVHMGNWIDVRDVAEAHVKVLTTPEAGGERFIVAAGPYCWQDVLDAIHAESEDSAETALFANVPRGNPGAGKTILHSAFMDTTKAKTILGLKYTKIEKTAKDTAKVLLERQW